jgi:LysR family transcriptional regulator, hydrogen peroxide-inducible genes activator
MRHLQCFTMLVDEQNFGRAATRLSITQPALSHAIKQLERVVGTQLLRRSTHKLELTQAGSQLLERARFLVNTFDLTLEDIDKALHQGRALVRVGTIPSASALLVGCIGTYAGEVSPGLEFTLQDGLADSLVARTLSGELDVVVAAVTEAPVGLSCVTLFEDPIVLVVPRGHSLSAAPSASWRRLGGEKLVIFASGTMPALGDIARTQFGEGGPEPFRVNYLETLYSMVRGGLALGLMPRLYAASIRDPGLAVVRLLRPTLHRSVSLIYQSGARRNALLGHFIEYLEAHLPRGYSKRM